MGSKESPCSLISFCACFVEKLGKLILLDASLFPGGERSSKNVLISRMLVMDAENKTHACNTEAMTNVLSCGWLQYGIIESQNHRTVGVGRDLCGSSNRIPLLKQGHLQQAAQDILQAGFEYLQRRRIHNLPGQPVPVLHHPQSEEVLRHIQTELPMLQFVPIAPCPVAGHY